MHSWATERKKGKKWVQKTNFLANGKRLSHFMVLKLPLSVYLKNNQCNNYTFFVILGLEILLILAFKDWINPVKNL
jgi:hypothetical protein